MRNHHYECPVCGSKSHTREDDKTKCKACGHVEGTATKKSRKGTK